MHDRVEFADRANGLIESMAQIGLKRSERRVPSLTEYLEGRDHEGL